MKDSIATLKEDSKEEDPTYNFILFVLGCLFVGSIPMLFMTIIIHVLREGAS